ncbi:MAG TPA: hypothetical protein VK196_02745 [Magnetospirillum sp.]|nr:hypothetical protein [Magnetospirillum sp.]
MNHSITPLKGIEESERELAGLAKLMPSSREQALPPEEEIEKCQAAGRSFSTVLRRSRKALYELLAQIYRSYLHLRATEQLDKVIKQQRELEGVKASSRSHPISVLIWAALVQAGEEGNGSSVNTWTNALRLMAALGVAPDDVPRKLFKGGVDSAEERFRASKTGERASSLRKAKKAKKDMFSMHGNAEALLREFQSRGRAVMLRAYIMVSPKLKSPHIMRIAKTTAPRRR